MVLGIILIDNDFFSVFEHFLPDFESYGIGRKELYQSIEKIDSENYIVYKTIQINKLRIDEKISLILISPENRTLSEETKENLLKIASKVASGDRLAIRNVLLANSEAELAFFY